MSNGIYKKVNSDEINTYSFFLQYQCFAGRRQMISGPSSKRRESMGPQDPPGPQDRLVLNRLLNTSFLLAFKLRPSLNCRRRQRKGLVTINKHNEKLMIRRNNDTPKLGALHRRSNLGRSPQISLKGVSQSSPDTKKNQDF